MSWGDLLKAKRIDGIRTFHPDEPIPPRTKLREIPFNWNNEREFVDTYEEIKKWVFKDIRGMPIMNSNARSVFKELEDDFDSMTSKEQLLKEGVDNLIYDVKVKLNVLHIQKDGIRQMFANV